MPTPTPLLTTKFYIPPARPNLVSRPRLTARLAQGLTRPLTLVSAPPGFGKTTLVSEWCATPAARGFHLAWLSLDADDNDPTRFLTYLIAALATLKPALGETTLALLHSPQPPSSQVVLAGLVNDLAELPAPFALILDDYHAITAQPVHDVLAFLLDHLPAPMRLVILTRADPPLALGRFRARNQLSEIRAADLRFTNDEAETFLNRAMGLALSADDVTALAVRTEGWISGLQLAALSLEGRPDPSEFIKTLAGSHRYIVDYLAEEVLNRQTEAVSTFLMETSILHRLTGELCDAITHRTDGQATLTGLEQANLFLIPLDDERRWYRYHHLFREAIHNRLQLAHADWIPGLHRCAAAWFEQHGFAAEAIGHAIAGDDKERAAWLIEQNALPMVMRRELGTLGNWLGAVEAVLDEHPWLCVCRAWLLLFTGRIDGVEKYLRDAEQLAEANPPAEWNEGQDMLGQIAAIRAGAAFFRGDATRAIGHAERALEHLAADRHDVRAVVSYALGGAFWVQGDIDGAVRSFEEVGRCGRAAGNVAVQVMALCSQGRLLSLKGQLRRAAETFRQAMQIAASQPGPLVPVAAEACAGLGVILYEWDRLDAAADYLERFAELGRLSGSASYEVLSGVLLARLRQAQRDSAGALDSLQAAEELAQRSALGTDIDTLFTGYRLGVRLAGGDLESAARLAQDRGLSLEGADNWQREPEYCAFARVLMAQGEYDAALALLERLLRQTEPRGLLGRVVELLVLRALVLRAMGRRPEALATLRQSLSLAQPEGYVRVFLDEGPPMAQLLREAKSHGMATEYVEQLLLALDAPSAPGTALHLRPALAEPLSDRELEILRLVAQGMSNQQIADALIIATGTVKKHLHNIFGKLGVQSRTHCLAKARELNLL